MMREYPKIQSVYLRDPATNHKTFLLGEYAVPAFKLLRYVEWRGTEKVDGTNIRVDWDGYGGVRFGGRSKDAQIPAHLLEYLQEHFTPERMSASLKGPLTLYGEGYGAKIQKSGGLYRPDPGFILFDALADDVSGAPIWLEEENVTEIARTLDIPRAPVIFSGTLTQAEMMISAPVTSEVAADKNLNAEGLVLRPAVELRDRRGNRIITKLKTRDFAPVG